MIAKLTKTKKFTLLSILFSIGIVFYLRSNASLGGSIVQERILGTAVYNASIGGYYINDTTKVIDACAASQVRNKLTDAETAAKQKDLEGKFWIKGRDKLKLWIVDRDSKHLQDYASENAAAYIGPAIFLVLSVLCCIFQLIWILTFSYCRPDKPEEGCCRGPCCQKTACISSIILPLLTFTVTLGWIIQMGKLIDTLDDTKCGVVSIVNDIKNGVNYVDSAGVYTQFSGMKGFSYIFQQFLTDLGTTRADNNAAAIAVSQFNTQGDNMFNTQNSYYNSYKSSTVTSPYDGTSTITPDSVSSLTSGISSAVSTEITNLKTYATNVNTASAAVYAVSNAAPSGSSTYTTLASGVNAAIATFDSLYNTLNNMNIKPDSLTDHKSTMVLITYIIGLAILGIVIAFWLSLTFTHGCKKCICCCECFSKIAQILKCLFALLFCILGILFVITAGLTVNLCHFQYEFYNNTAFYAEVQPNETTMKSFLDACAYSSSSKQITSFLDSNQAAAFNSLTSIYDGLYGYATYKSTYYDNNLTTPTNIATYYSTLATYGDFSANDYQNVASAHQYTTIQSSLNTLVSCTGDKWVMNTSGSNCTGYTIWLNSNAQTYGNTSSLSMCMPVPAFKALSYTVTNRYTGGCMSSADIATANTYVNNLYTFYQSANTLYTNERNTLNAASGTKFESEALLTQFYNNIANYNVLALDFSTYYSYINSFSNTSTALATCSFFREDMLIFSNTICFKTVSAFAEQTIWLSIMGPTMCLMSICMFAAIRCPLQKKDDANKTAPQTNYQTPGQQPTQFQMVDKNVNSNYVMPQNQMQTGYAQPGYGQTNMGGHGLDIQCFDFAGNFISLPVSK